MTSKIAMGRAKQDKVKPPMRAVKLTLAFLTASKRRKVAALLEAYRAAVNFYLHLVWSEGGGLDATTLARLEQTRLSERYKSAALKQALGIIQSTIESAHALGIEPSCPTFKGGAKLDTKFVDIKDSEGHFDLAIRLSTLHKGHRITLLTKKTKPFLKWSRKPGTRLIQGGELSEDFVIVWFELPLLEPKTEGDILGVDIGINKLLADNEGNHYGTEFKTIRDKIKRKRPGSKLRQRACREREQYIAQIIKELPFDRLAALGVEDLKNVKQGKTKDRGKSFRKAVAPWTYRHALNQIELNAQEHRVRLVLVNPANTSRTCPQCGIAHKENRQGENFRCIECNYTLDADTVGAVNIFNRTCETLRRLESLVPF